MKHHYMWMRPSKHDGLTVILFITVFAESNQIIKKNMLESSVSIFFYSLIQFTN